MITQSITSSASYFYLSVSKVLPFSIPDSKVNKKYRTPQYPRTTTTARNYLPMVPYPNINMNLS